MSAASPTFGHTRVCSILATQKLPMQAGLAQPLQCWQTQADRLASLQGRLVVQKVVEYGMHAQECPAASGVWGSVGVRGGHHCRVCEEHMGKHGDTSGRKYRVNAHACK
jgi:hypothetical protein